MERLRAWVFSTFMAIDTGVLGMLALPTLFRRDWAVAFSKFWVSSIEWGLRVFGGVTREVTGIENLPEGPAIIVPKHQSAWETLALNYILPRPIYILKKELKWIPVFGWWATACGFIYVDRTAGGSALKYMVAEATKAINEGKSHIVIFPEGTRMPEGETGRYHPGVAALAKALQLPIIPVAHNSGSHWRHHERKVRPGVITLQFMPPVDPTLPRGELMRTLENTIEPATRALEAESARRHGLAETPVETPS